MFIRILILILIATAVTAVMVTPRLDLRCVAQLAIHADDEEFEEWTCLHYAAARGDRSVVKDMLKHGSEVNARTRQGRTALAEASRVGHDRVVQTLIDAGADVNVRDAIGQFTPLHLAAENNHPAVVRKLLAAGAEVDAANQWDQTPLWMASWQPEHGNTEIARILVANGADPHKPDEKGHTPLHMAARTAHDPMVEYLLNAGADIEHRNSNGRTPLFQAVTGQHPSTVEILLDHGADANASSEDWTPLRIALQENNLEIADLLQAHGASGYERLASTARINAGYKHLKQDDYDAALAAFDEAIKLQPDNSRGFYYRGLTYHRMGEEQKAQNDLMQSLTLDPGNAGALEWMATLYANLGEHGRARELLARLVELRPDYGRGHFLLSQTLDHLGDSSAALADRERACELDYKPACQQENARADG